MYGFCRAMLADRRDNFNQSINPSFNLLTVNNKIHKAINVQYKPDSMAQQEELTAALKN